jgi:hypothetical protein
VYIVLPIAFREETMSATPTPTVALLKAILDAFNGHDVDAVMAFFADDCVPEMPRGPDPWGSRHQGFAAVRRGAPIEVRRHPGRALRGRPELRGG